MKHVSLIVPNGEFSITNLDLTRQLFTWVNDNLPTPLFDLKIVGLSSEANIVGGLYTVKTDCLINEIQHTDVVIIPAMFGDPQELMEQNEALVPWVEKQYQNGADLVSMCVGAFFLGGMGILNGKRCSTHWGAAEDFKRLFPEVIVEDERIVSESHRIYTSGGALAFTNLLIYLIERYAGREVAIAAAKAYMIDVDRTSQSPFMMFSGQKSHEDQEVLKAQEYIETHFKDKISVEDLCDEIGVGRRTFERRFKSSTTNTIFEYIQRVKIEAAKTELEKGVKTVSQVMFEVGYNDTKAFREIFKRITGMTPVAYKERYTRMQQVA
ncbi:helix-turn-helix domain-containing protein [Ekhidna sp.]|uniref:GlxA family transcriptional regulator n=1 Tax=Ekhidna sp. TaxID=2608089 RepID=UPI0032EFCD8D